MRHNFLGSKGVEEFAKGNTTVTQLDLSYSAIGWQDGVEKFAKANKVVTQLDLAGNRFWPDSAEKFAQANKVVTQVNLSSNELGSDGAERFAKANKMVTQVNLSNNGICPNGAEKFAETNKIITQVDLGSNQLGPDGVKQFVETNTVANQVNLKFNEMTDVGANALMSVLEKKNNIIFELDVSGNGLSLEVEKRLQQRVKRNKAHREGWMNYALLAAAIRSTKDSAISTSVLALMPHILEKVGEKMTVKQLFMDTQFFRNVVGEKQKTESPKKKVSRKRPGTPT